MPLPSPLGTTAVEADYEQANGLRAERAKGILGLAPILHDDGEGGKVGKVKKTIFGGIQTL